MIDIDTRIRQNSSVLERISKAFTRESPEYQALRRSAFAFGYAMLHHQDEFDEYVENVHKPLTKAERARLKKYL
jgi:hypothetical protein